jgi:hypothetical protein
MTSSVRLLAIREAAEQSIHQQDMRDTTCPKDGSMCIESENVVAKK